MQVMQFAYRCVWLFGREEQIDGVLSCQRGERGDVRAQCGEALWHVGMQHYASDTSAAFLEPRAVDHDIDASADTLRQKGEREMQGWCACGVREIEVFISYDRACGVIDHRVMVVCEAVGIVVFCIAVAHGLDV